MKNNLLKFLGAVLIFLTGLGIGAGGFFLFLQNNLELRYHLLELPAGDQPQELIGAFVQAIVQGDPSSALELWEADDLDPQSQMAKRKDRVISELNEAGIQSEFSILDMEWWTTCCTPNVTCDSRDAGGARIWVQFLDKNGGPISYVFDIFTREQPYWGSAAGYPPRDWVIRDVYPREQKPLFWPLIYTSQTQSTQH